MKFPLRVLFAIFLIFSFSSSFSQSAGVMSAEYFWDNDPGQGSGTPMAATDGSFGQAFEAISQNISNLPDSGMHKLCIRAEDSTGNWGPVFSIAVQILGASTAAPHDFVSAAEYFWDNDPGQGNGNPMIAVDGNFNQAFEAIAQNNMALPSIGAHSLNLRAEDPSGNWGPVFTVVVQVLGDTTQVPTDNIAAAEYFWDNDPGQGNGNPMVAFDGNFNQAFEIISQSNMGLPSVGGHTLNIRAKDVAGNWGPVFTVVVQVLGDTTQAPPDNIAAAEYFWDNDPGQGNGNPMVAFDGNFNQAFEAITQNNIGLPSVGGHTLNIRAKDVAGNWGPVFTVAVQVLNNTTPAPSDNIAAAEYFWDNDPGQGNGNPMVAFDGNFNQAFEIISQNNIGTPSIGAHTLNIRAQDVAGNWGPVFTVVVQVLNNTTPAPSDNIAAAEYFWDNDPGQGNGSPMVAFDGNFNQAFEVISQTNIGLPAQGMHTLNIRAEDVSGNWGPVFTVVTDVENTSTVAGNTGVMAAEYFFDADPGQGNGTPMLAQGGNFGGDFQGLLGSAIPAPVTAGMHLLSMRSEDASGNWGPVFSIVVNIDTTIGAPDVLLSGNTALCTDRLSYNLYSTPLVAGTTYNWNITGGNITSGIGTNSVRVTWNSSGPYKLLVTGCNSGGAFCSSDSLVPVITSVATSTINHEICEGLTFAGYSSTGTYIDTFNAANGCDSIRTLNLTVLNVSRVTVPQTVCYGESYLGYTQTGTYIDTFAAANSCDSIRTLNLTVLNKDALTISQSICPGQSYLGYSHSGTYVDTLLASNGCDSIRTLNLTVLQVAHASINQSVCYGQSYSEHDSTGTFVDTFSAANGCDSIRTLHLTVMPLISSTHNQTVCYAHTFDGHSASGLYADTLTASNGCDSISILNLTIMPQITSTVNQSICSGQNYSGHSSSGTYVDTLTTANGCDSIRTLVLTVANSITTAVNKNICNGQSYYGHAATGTYVDTFTAIGGCDSLRTLNLLVLPILSTTDAQTICEGQTYGGHGTSGIFVDTLSSSYGCDSIRTLHLTINPVIRDTLKRNICEGDTFENHTTSGVYIDSLTAETGCDSIVTLKLSVNQPPVSPAITRFGNTLVSSSAVYYQWYRDSVLLTGDTAVALVITQSGNYQVEVFDSFGCGSRSAAYVDSTLGINNIGEARSIEIFPNPTTGQVNIALTGNVGNEPLSIKVTDMLGRTLISQSQVYTEGKINMQIDISIFASGIYMLEIKQGNWITNSPVILTK